MATVTVEVNGRPYAVGCADGQEERVKMLAGQFNEKIGTVAGQVGQVGDLNLFLMGALMLADELFEAKKGRQVQVVTANPVTPTNDGVAEALNAVASRLEKMAQSF